VVETRYILLVFLLVSALVLSFLPLPLLCCSTPLPPLSDGPVRTSKAQDLLRLDPSFPSSPPCSRFLRISPLFSLYPAKQFVELFIRSHPSFPPFSVPFALSSNLNRPHRSVFPSLPGSTIPFFCPRFLRAWRCLTRFIGCGRLLPSPLSVFFRNE